MIYILSYIQRTFTTTFSYKWFGETPTFRGCPEKGMKRYRTGEGCCDERGQTISFSVIREIYWSQDFPG